MKKNLLLLFFTFFLINVVSAETKKEQMDKFITDLMGRMTLEEKIGQLNLPTYPEGDLITGVAQNRDIEEKIARGELGGIFNVKDVQKVIEIQKIAIDKSRMKIPLLFGLDVIHGYKTIFPIPLGLAATWDMEAIEKSAHIGAIEASADGINWTFSPMVDISRDPRWGRVAEGAGEDPFLGGAIAKAMVRGYQGDNTYSTNDRILACVKHFALYGAPDAGKDYNTVDMSRLRMFNEYMYPYQAAIDAGVETVMASFNEVDGVPATANKWLMTDILRNQWGFKGFVVSDYTGVAEMISHGIGDMQTVSARALEAGVDMDMVSEGYIQTLATSLKEGKIKMEDIDTACRRILEAKYKLGLFDDPFKFCDVNRAKTQIFTDENRTLARKIASESFVLLKNDNNTLPLKKGGIIAVVGPLADTRSNMPGTWSITADLSAPATVVEGIQQVAGKGTKVLYAKGSNLVKEAEYEKRATVKGLSLNRDERSDEQLLKEALTVAEQSDVIVAALGESAKMNGEGNCRVDIDIPDVQRELLTALVKTGKPVILVLFTGRPLTLTWEQENVPAILNTWFGGSEAAPAIADVLFGDANPCGKLTMTFPRHVGQVPIYYNYKNTGRPGSSRYDEYKSTYLDITNEPLYPFGFGLSYTKFKYGDIQLSKKQLSGNDKLEATINITNTGKVAGKEIVQLYIRDLVGSITRPVKELKGFEKISLEAGESKRVTFDITPELLKFYNYDLEYDWESGDFEIMVGPNSKDVKSVKVNWSKN